MDFHKFTLSHRLSDSFRGAELASSWRPVIEGTRVYHETRNLPH